MLKPNLKKLAIYSSFSLLNYTLDSNWDPKTDKKENKLQK